MTQPIPNGVLVLLPDCYNSPITKKGEVYGAVVWRNEDSPDSLSREVVRVALDSINQSEGSASIPKSLLSKHPHYSTASTQGKPLDLVVRTYDESSVPDFIGKIKAILQKERLPEEPWQTGDSVKSASLAVDINTLSPTYLERRPFIQWTFQTSQLQVSSFGNHIQVSGPTHSVIIDGLVYSIDMKILAQIRDTVSDALDNIAETYQSMYKQELLATLGRRDVVKVEKPLRYSWGESVARSFHRRCAPDCTASFPAAIVIISLIVFTVLAIKHEVP